MDFEYLVRRREKYALSAIDFPISMSLFLVNFHVSYIVIFGFSYELFLKKLLDENNLKSI